MKQFFKFFFASLLALVVAGVFFFVAFFVIIGSISRSVSGAAAKEEQSTIKDNSILYINLTEDFHEQGESNTLALFTGGSSKSSGLLDLLKSISYAKTDDKVKGIYLKTGG